jgi:DNA-binding transcriptional ArsR family regulator
MTSTSSDAERRAHHHEWFFETLANPLRMRILLMLMDKPRSVGEIVDASGEEQSKVSHALRILMLCHLIRLQKKGRLHIYTAESRRVRALFKLVDEAMCAACAGCCGQEERKRASRTKKKK